MPFASWTWCLAVWTDQELKATKALQLDALQRACVDRIFVDHASGSVQDRPGLTSALECARSGDSLVVKSA